jgi:HTH-type transcriptional regulator / antitoxin HipB
MDLRTTRDLGAAIKEARKLRGLSQAALAKAVRVHQPKISDIERGAPSVRIGLVLQILRALNMSLTIAPTTTPSKPDHSGSKHHVKGDPDLDKIADTGLD